MTRLLDIPYGKKGESVKVPSHHILDDEDESNAPLIAGGVRRKKVAAMLNVDVYVIGLYFLPKACKKHEGEEDAFVSAFHNFDRIGGLATTFGECPPFVASLSFSFNINFGFDHVLPKSFDVDS